MTYDFEREIGIEAYLEAREANAPHQPDECEICHGSKGGIRGNENIVDGIIMCDYCNVEYMGRTKP